MVDQWKSLCMSNCAARCTPSRRRERRARGRIEDSSSENLFTYIRK